jgi:hypothetical protein
VGYFAFKISISCRTFRFLHLGVVSLSCEWSWAIRLSAATVVAPHLEPKTALMQMLFWRNNIDTADFFMLVKLSLCPRSIGKDV